MNRKYKVMISAATASALTFTALAQTASTENPYAASDAVVQHQVAERSELMKSTAHASAVVGQTVENLQQVKLGRVKTFALDLRSGRIVEVIVSTSGGQLVAVPPGALHPDAGLKFLRLDASAEKMEAAPRFDAGQWAAETQSNRVTEAYTYFGEQPYFVTGQSGDNYQTTNQDGTITPLGTRTLEHVREAEQARQTVDPNNTISVVNPDGTTSRDYYSDQHAAIGVWSVLGYDQSEHKLIGMALRNRQGAKLGQVEDVMVDLKAGRVAAIFIRTDRFFWTGGWRYSVPPTEVWLNQANDALVLDVSKEEFTQSPHYDISGWPNYPLPGYAAGTYSPYMIEPYNNSDAPQTVATGR
jgi:sporulation protein YlmC with PRC-barrel domain